MYELINKNNGVSFLKDLKNQIKIEQLLKQDFQLFFKLESEKILEVNGGFSPKQICEHIYNWKVKCEANIGKSYFELVNSDFELPTKYGELDIS